jgi:hypothetical protein
VHKNWLLRVRSAATACREEGGTTNSQNSVHHGNSLQIENVLHFAIIALSEVLHQQ